jgi:transcriptional regulator with XRE-family HTH domain
MDAGEIVARNLRRMRVARGIAQEILAIDARIDRTYISRLERSLENPTVAVLDRLAKALDVSIAEFFAPIDPATDSPPVLKKGRKAKAKP